VLMTLGLTSAAYSQEGATLVGEASCIDGEGKYVITWTLTLTLGDQETATAETPLDDITFFDGIDLIGQPQHDGYPFQAESGNIFTAGSGRLVNGPNVARTSMDISVYNPDRITAAGSIVSSAGSTDVEATVTRPAVCTG
jgi:hypothetical protein